MLKAFIVDDEAPARSELAYLLDQIDDVEVVAEAGDVRSAIELLNKHSCDVIFLDINMPEASGVKFAEALQSLSRPPIIVFVTAYSEYAMDAFRVNAMDYLQKPVDLRRLRKTVERVQNQVEMQSKTQQVDRIAVEKAQRKILIEIDKIRYVEARDDYAYVQTDTDRYFSTISLAQLESRLEKHGFFRVHRSYLVNLAYVEEIEVIEGGKLLVTLNGVDKKINVSRRKASAFKKALGIL